jgi:hypothetical protein
MQGLIKHHAIPGEYAVIQQISHLKTPVFDSLKMPLKKTAATILRQAFPSDILCVFHQKQHV